MPNSSKVITRNKYSLRNPSKLVLVNQNICRPDNSVAKFVNYTSILKMEIDEIPQETRKNGIHSLV